jgi:guanylate kinase
LINRHTETIDIIKKRIKQAKKELSMKNHFKYVITNDLIDKARNELSIILNKELLD